MKLVREFESCVLLFSPRFEVVPKLGDVVSTFLNEVLSPAGFMDSFHYRIEFFELFIERRVGGGAFPKLSVVLLEVEDFLVEVFECGIESFNGLCESFIHGWESFWFYCNVLHASNLS